MLSGIYYVGGSSHFKFSKTILHEASHADAQVKRENIGNFSKRIIRSTLSLRGAHQLVLRQYWPLPQYLYMGHQDQKER
jgi:hypothetical protein